jgi:exonuclease SbcC
MIILKKLKLINFLSHKKTEINFENNQKILIDGKSGAGKSSVVEGIVWALYGEGRGNNRFLIRNGETEATVSLRLFDDSENKFYIINRSITAKKHELEILHSKNEDGPYIPILVTGVKMLQEYIEKKLLHSSYILFLNSICYQQGNPEGFAQQTATKRKDLLLEILRTSDYDEYYEKIRLIVREKESEINELTGANNTLKTRYSLLESAIKDLSLHEEIKNTETKILELKKDLESIKELSLGQEPIIKEMLASRGSQNTLNSLRNDKIREIEKLEEQLKELKNLDIIILSLDHETYLKLKDSLAKLEDKRTLYYAWSENYNKILTQFPIDDTVISKEVSGRDEAIKQLNEIKNNNETKCVHCGEICPRCEERIKKSLDFFEEQIKTKEYNISSYNKQLKEKEEMIVGLGPKPEWSESGYTETVKVVKNLEAKELEYQQAVRGDSAIDEMSSLLERSKKELEKLNSDLVQAHENTTKLSNKIIDYSEQKDFVEESIKQLNDNLSSFKIRFSIAENSKLERDSIEKEIKTNEVSLKQKSEDINGLSLLKDAFGQNGIKSILVDSVIPTLENKINDALSKLSDFRVRLDTQKSGAGKDVVLEGLFISIINEQGEQLDFSNYSGGEKLKITVAISEALAELQKIGFRILDELFVGIDSTTIEGFVSVLDKLQSRFSQLICISHLKEIKDQFDNKIEVIKINGISSII